VGASTPKWAEFFVANSTDVAACAGLLLGEPRLHPIRYNGSARSTYAGLLALRGNLVASLQMRIAPEILALDGQRCFAMWRGLLVQYWYETRLAAVQEHSAIVTRLFQREPGPFASLIVVAPNSPLPEKEARKQLDALAKQIWSRCVCHAYVYQGSGFGAAAVRAIMLAITTASAGNVATKVCATLPEALEFMAPRLDPKRFGTSAERAEALASIEAHFATGSAA
jgi:hypothetical protein